MKTGFYYLAGPHKGTSAEEAYRYATSLKITTEFLNQGIHIFSPIVYGKHITEACHFPVLEERRRMMMNYLLEFLKASQGLILLTMEGWEQSWGLNQELIFCQENQIPVYLMDPAERGENYTLVFSEPLNSQQLSQLLKAA